MSIKIFGPRSVANRVWLASMSPLAAGLVAFSFAMVAFGSSIYISAVPGMFTSDVPFVGNIFKGPSDDDTSSADSSAESEALSEEAANDGSADDGGLEFIGGSAIAIMKSGLSVPAFDFAILGNTQGGDPSNPSGGEVPPQGGTDPTQPGEPVEPSEPTEDEKRDAVIHDVLVGAYNELPALYEKTVASLQTLAVDSVNMDKALKREHFNNATTLNNEIGATKNRYMLNEGKVYIDGNEIEVPQTSKWYQQYKLIWSLYGNLATSIGYIRTGWMQAGLFNSPYDSYMSNIIANSTDGQLNELLAFVATYNKVRL